MTVDYAKHFSYIVTPQSEPIPNKPMVPNSSGGYAFEVNDFTRLNRFLVLGAEGGSYYASEKKLTIENAQCVVRCLDFDPARTIRTIVEISDGGRAPKNEPAIFALAIAAGYSTAEARRMALEALPKVCRIPTHLFAFWEAVRHFRGRGAGLRKAMQRWYTERPVEQLALHVAKYPQRNGWSHRDVLRMVRPRTEEPAREAVFRWAVGGRDALGGRVVMRKRDSEGILYPSVEEHLPRFLAAVDEARAADEATVVRLIRDHDLPRECVPTHHLNSAAVWEALLEKMPLTAMVRNLGKMSAVGLLKPLSNAAKKVADTLGDRDHIKKSRLHPMAILIAARTYGQGHGDKGSLRWNPVSTVNDALDSAFYLAFDFVEPANKKTLIALDVSGSMGSPIAGSSLSCREASAAMAMVTARTEPLYQIMAFAHTLVPVDITKTDRLSDVIAKTARLPFGGTNCSLPMICAIQNQLGVDTFAVYTDSETYAGSPHPCQALVQYRRLSGINSRLVVVGMVASSFSIADPSDPGMLDVAGFNTATPGLISDFSAGRI